MREYYQISSHTCKSIHLYPAPFLIQHSQWGSPVGTSSTLCVCDCDLFSSPLFIQKEKPSCSNCFSKTKNSRHFERWWSLWWVIIIFSFFLSGEFLGYFEVLPSWTGWRFVRSRSCNDPCRRMTLLLPPANKEKKGKTLGLDTQKISKKKDTKNESVSFCVFFSFFLFNPLRAWNGNEQQGKHTKKRRRGREGRLVVQ